MLKTVEITTKKRIEFIDVTSIVRQAVTESGVRDGLCLVYVPHTTCGITVNEHADPDVVSDIISQLEKIVPESGNYNHIEGNSDAHIKASMIGSSESIIISDSKLMLGVWQGIFLCEFDGPRKRHLYIKTLEG
ncbi:MAG TPA: secondary thiamine-phosphate synthase enzyme YjbQ [Fervidobacterium sp.]|jgi:secondary thiamine-phosphate synthase enzyme|nr:secondary thiamine-phosphate synthase enzyme YjbQ [Fervidobacterium sp.]NLH37616.1 YjbQ family protein [Thermotogaceae bacterium]HOK33688.1 secondary thiamine-phosphate synthase enzyme YjbQ [Fervidobacterium sp.]HOL04007.1 secondary thiamine-phosphate synthase enzyme YjbQ [Fervidobacterium sp.]HOP82135.1 secondary thiamine-phosphate synthase enzyme YjbQ [Fervidobacterium sp.]